jgi:hypothetical protein
MGVRILHDKDQERAVLYCSTTDWAFGPMFRDTLERDGVERAGAFLRWLQRGTYTPKPEDLNAGGRVFGFKGDARAFTDEGLERAYTTWLAQEEAQYLAEQHADERERA